MAKSRLVADPELQAMGQILEILDDLSPEGQVRVVTYITDRFDDSRPMLVSQEVKKEVSDGTEGIDRDARTVARDGLGG